MSRSYVLPRTWRDSSLTAVLHEIDTEAGPIVQLLVNHSVVVTEMTPNEAHDLSEWLASTPDKRA